MSDDHQSSVLLTTLSSGRKKYRVFFHRGVIVWDNEKPPFGKFFILPFKNVFLLILYATRMRINQFALGCQDIVFIEKLLYLLTYKIKKIVENVGMN